MLVLFALLMLAGILISTLPSVNLDPWMYIITLTVMTVITMGAFLVVRRGARKGGKEQVFHTLGALGGKFLLYLIFILIYWAAGKNLSKPFIIAFFALYLVLTFFLIRVLYKILKTN